MLASTSARGVFELAEGNWPTAEITITRSARDNVQPAVNYLIAARAADLQGAHERRAGWLRMAREAAPDEIAPVLVTQAEMQLKNGQFEAARETLQELDASGQQNPRGLLLLAYGSIDSQASSKSCGRSNRNCAGRAAFVPPRSMS